MYLPTKKEKEIARKLVFEMDVFRELREIFDSIAFIKSDDQKHSKGKIVYADTEKVKEKYYALLPYRFIITFYADSEDLDDKRLEVLVYHELKHVGYEPSEGRYYIVPHDVEDFSDLIKRYGIDWVIRSDVE